MAGDDLVRDNRSSFVRPVNYRPATSATILRPLAQSPRAMTLLGLRNRR